MSASARFACACVLVSALSCRDASTRPLDLGIEVAPSTLDFGSVEVGSTAERALALRSSARASWEVTLETQPPFEVQQTAEVVAGGETLVAVRFKAPERPGLIEGTLVVRVDGAVEPILLRAEATARACPELPACQRLQPTTEEPCALVPVDDGAACETACITNGVCASGSCVGDFEDCDDGNACTADVCGLEGCTHSAIACPTPTDPCLAAICDPSHGCATVEVADGTSCGANDGCDLRDVCLSGRCVKTAPPDGSSCTTQCGTPGQCVAGVCDGPGNCDDHNLCTADSCGADGGCVHVDESASCPNASPCTVATCDPQSGCGVVPVSDGVRCDPAPSCTSVSICMQGQCVAHPQTPPTSYGCTCSDIRPEHALALGQWHACRLTPSSGVECWGDNAYGELGDGTFADHHRPASVPGLSNVVELSAGGLNTCARTTNGDVYCWGMNDQQQVAPTSASSINTPTQVVLPKRAMSIAVGTERFACAALEDGSVWCWGALGRVPGYGGNSTRHPPTKVPGFSDVIQLSAVWYDLCALRANGTVLCWGWNLEGELGDGTMTAQTSPVPAILPDGGPVSDVVEIAMSAAMPGLCVRTLLGEVRCASMNGPTPAAPTFPEPGLWVGHVELGGCATQLGRGGFSGCARMGDGTVRCFGHINGSGQLGTGSTAVPPDWMSDVSHLSGVSEIQGDSLFACANLDDGGFVCWGDNLYGQLGDGTTSPKLAP